MPVGQSHALRLTGIHIRHIHPCGVMGKQMAAKDERLTSHYIGPIIPNKLPLPKLLATVPVISIPPVEGHLPSRRIRWYHPQA